MSIRTAKRFSQLAFLFLTFKPCGIYFHKWYKGIRSPPFIAYDKFWMNEWIINRPRTWLLSHQGLRGAQAFPHAPCLHPPLPGTVSSFSRPVHRLQKLGSHAIGKHRGDEWGGVTLSSILWKLAVSQPCQLSIFFAWFLPEARASNK